MVDRTITFRIEGEEIPAQVFYQKVGAFLDVLRDVERNVGAEDADHEPAPVKWVVQSIRAESPVVMTLRADPPDDEAEEDVAPRVISIAAAGLKRLQAQDPVREAPRGFSLPTLERVRTLVRPVNGAATLGVAVVAEGETIPLSGQVTANVERLLRPVYHHYGTVEGILEVVSVAGNRPRIRVKDRLTGRPINCFVPRDRMDDVLRVFGRRVSVYGRVRTNELGDIVDIRLESIEAFPPEDELPTVEQVAGAFDITSGKSIEEHLASLRDAS